METAIQMVCLECDTPLNFTETYVDGELATMNYEHPMRAGGEWDHNPLPALADPLDPAQTGCDCCGIAAPRPEGFANTWLVAEDRPVRLRSGDRVFDYSTPWSVCAACSAAIEEDDLRLLLARAAEHSRMPEWISAEQREAGFDLTRDLLLAFLAARPRRRP
ncbi:hypothetical protein [Actinocorallia longicatena]|uniref:Uncharacterized protein n=1 Tax=Actinocorallia longicatena TaxID=111803 RepID=A0ABP6QFK1_9ACTN